MAHDIAERITVNPEQGGGRHICGMRIRVVDVPDLLAAGLSLVEILEDLPDFDTGDVRAALRFGAPAVHSS